jgi:catechol 2,3-dioxygenase-like lactoylglutathione lyase family enzyme
MSLSMPAPPPFAVERIDHVVLRVSDLEVSIAFYAAVLGSAVVRRRDDLGLVHLRAGASMLDLVSVDGVLGRNGGAAAGAEGRNMDHLCLRVEPFDELALRAHLDALGVRHSGAAAINFGAEGDGPSIYCTDPDGNSIELKGPPRR